MAFLDTSGGQHLGLTDYVGIIGGFSSTSIIGDQTGPGVILVVRLQLRLLYYTTIIILLIGKHVINPSIVNKKGPGKSLAGQIRYTCTNTRNSK